MTTEFATPTAESAVTQDSAPVNTLGTEVSEPVETSADAPVVDTDTHETTETMDSEPSGAEKRIRQLVTQRKAEEDARRRAESEAAYYRGLAEGRVSPTQGTHTQQQRQEPELVAPNLDNYETYDAFESAREEYLIQKAKQEAKREIAQQLAQQQRASAESARQATFNQRIEKAAEENPDILDIVRDPTLPVSEHMLPVLYESDIAPELLQHLNNNRKEAQRIASLPPVLAARELGIIEATIKSKPKAVPPPKVSMAPTPIKTVTPSNTPVVDEENLPIDDWMARRNSNQFKRR